MDVNNYKIQTWLEDRYAERVGKDDYKKLRERFRGKDTGAVARVMESELIERLVRRFKTRDTGPASAFHAELLERLTQQTKIDDSALVKLAETRGETMRDALLKLGLETSRIGISAPAQQTAKDKLVGSKMSLGAGKGPPTEAAPAGLPAAATP